MAKKKSKSATQTKAVPKTLGNVGGDPDLRRLEQIFEIMAKHQIGELEWEDSDSRIHVRNQNCAPTSHQVMTASSSGVGSGASPVSTSVAPAAAAPAPAATPSNHKTVSSPFVGTFYRSPSPTAEVYVKEGQSVKRGDVLCIVEAMKLMNEIESEFSGKIIAVHVENGQPVEFGEALFTVQV